MPDSVAKVGNADPILVLRDVHQSFGQAEVLKGISFEVAKGGVICIIGPSGSGKSTLLRCINGLVPINRGSIRVGQFDVHKSFGAVEVLKGITFAVGRGEAVCIIGPSGSGKSTLLRCINGLVPMDRGEIHVLAHAVHRLHKDAEMVALRKDVSIVFQQYNLFPHKTALQNVMMAPIHVLKENTDEVRARALALLEKVGLASKRDAYPGELSGGQQQRVAIARSLAMRPEVMLFDEVTAALDPETVKEVLNTIKALAQEGMTCVIVTHEMRFAREIADCVYFTDGGVIVESGPPAELFDRPQKERMRAFLSQIL